MDLSRMADGTWQIIHIDTAANVLDLYRKIQANLAQLQADAGTTTPPVDPPPITTPPVTQPATGFRGIFAFNNMSNTALFSDHPSVAGTVLTRYWAELEPQPGVYNWSIIDNDMKPWVTAGKSVIIRVSAAGWKKWQPAQNSIQGTPQWVYDLGVKHVTDNDGSIKPEYWNTKFLSSLSNFIRAFAARYDGNPNITAIEMGIGDGGETKVDTGKDTNVLQHWQTIGYTDALWFQAIQTMITMYTGAFSKTPLVLMPDATFIGGSSGFNEQKLISYIAGLNNKNLWIQDNGLVANKPLPSSFSVLPKGYPLLSEQRNDTAASGDTLDADISTAISQGAQAVLIFTSDLQKASNQAVLAKYAALAGK